MCKGIIQERQERFPAEGIPLNDNHVIQDLDQAGAYKYMGMEEGEGAQHYTNEGQYQERV